MLRGILSPLARAKSSFSATSLENLFPKDPTITPSTPPVYPKHTIPFIQTNPKELRAWHDYSRDLGYLDTKDHWAVIDALGIPSAGIGLKLAFLSSKSLVDNGIPQMSIQLLPYIPCVQVELDSSINHGSEDGKVLHTELLAPESTKLTDPAHTPYVLARTNNGTDFVGGVYMRLFKDRQEALAARQEKAEQKSGKMTETEEGFMKELGALVAKRFFAAKK